jgi:hypothetical protein
MPFAASKTAACVVTTTWDSIDLIETFLVHYRRFGFDQVLLMDFDSTDGTRDIVLSEEWRGFVTLVPFPGMAALDSSNLMLAIAKQTRPHDWCLFCDPDELLVSPAMNIKAVLAAAVERGSMSVPRFNMTAPSSIARANGAHGSFVSDFTLRIDRRHLRSPERDVAKATLDPPWIFTAIPGKVLLRLDEALAVGDGDHVASTTRHELASAPAGVCILHYPFRRFSTFRDKIELARRGFHDNPQLPESHGWQLRRWIALADAGRLQEEYFQQFIPDQQVERLIKDGTLSRDERVARFHR